MKIGDKIVCVDAAKAPTTTLETGLVEGAVYTVRSYGPVSHYIDGDYYGVRLQEIDRGKDDHPEGGYGYDDLPFRASRFRPVVAPKVSKKIEERV